MLGPQTCGVYDFGQRLYPGVRFCNVGTVRPDLLDPHEPDRVADAVAQLGLAHVVVTSVDRDDLPDRGGGEHFAQTIQAIRATSPGTTIEILTPDFSRKEGALETVVAAASDVYSHWRPYPGSIRPFVPEPVIFIRYVCWIRLKKSVRPCSQNPV